MHRCVKQNPRAACVRVSLQLPSLLLLPSQLLLLGELLLLPSTSPWTTVRWAVSLVPVRPEAARAQCRPHDVVATHNAIISYRPHTPKPGKPAPLQPWPRLLAAVGGCWRPRLLATRLAAGPGRPAAKCCAFCTQTTIFAALTCRAFRDELFALTKPQGPIDLTDWSKGFVWSEKMRHDNSCIFGNRTFRGPSKHKSASQSQRAALTPKLEHRTNMRAHRRAAGKPQCDVIRKGFLPETFVERDQ